MRSPVMRNMPLTVAVMLLVAGLVTWPAAAQSQNPIQALKDAWKNAKPQPPQPQRGQPGQQQPGQKPGQQARGQGQTDDSGPIVPPAGTKVEQHVLAPVQQGAVFYVSPHGVHVATVGTSGSRATVIYDGVEGPKFDEILRQESGSSHVVFSPDGNRYAYCARSGDQFVVMVDGKELTRSSESYSGMFNGGLCRLGFTSNSRHMYYSSAVSQSRGPLYNYTRFVFDGKANAPAGSSQQASVPVFSPDGDHYAYIWNDPANQKPWALIVDGKPVGYLGSDPQWSADSQHLYTQLAVNLGPGRGTATDVLFDGKQVMRALQVTLHIPPVGNMVVAAVTGGAPGQKAILFLVVGGKKVVGSDVDQIGGEIGPVVFSPDGKHYAAQYRNMNNKKYVVVDGKKGLEYQTIDKLSFTPDSSRVVYKAGANGKYFLVVGEQESDAFAGLADPVVAPAGNRTGALPVNSGQEPTIVLDGKTMRPGGRDVGELSFSPDGLHYAYVATDAGGASRFVLDGVVQSSSGAGANALPGDRRYVFSPDSKHVAHFAQPPTPLGYYQGGIFLDGKYISLGPAPGLYSQLTFTPDSKHLLWVRGETIDSAPAFRVFVDGKPVAEGFTAGNTGAIPGWWEMAPDGMVSFLAQIENSLKRVTVTPSPTTSIETLLAGAR